ncbi:AMP-binding protein [Methylophaga sp. OBS4]|uniref:AMP-binding protein n=1 Tax=Methylophaga sp. OBS4 TaxID=2991935 RepID=UPI0022572A9C|nr:AMP-binding protein [Methylophaga sp. OBS4]MCX4186842.1 AMP-binding protein [Methylophaga sp. OBS4]
MNILLEHIHLMARQRPDTKALQDAEEQYSWLRCMTEIDRVAALLASYQQQTIALYADNSIDWIIVDLACMQTEVTLLPLPPFFSLQQLQHALKTSGATALIIDNNSMFGQQLAPTDSKNRPLTARLQLQALKTDGMARLPDETGKITYTSGSTGQPKGVCLSINNQLAVAQALLQGTGLPAIKHLCVLPLSTLLENIAGVYAPLMSGGQVTVLPAEQVGFNGGRGFDITVFLQAIDHYQPQSLILLPALLVALLTAIDKGWQPPLSLLFIAVGGSRVSPGLVQRARQAGLPVYEGYGLSECSSVVSLNTPHQDTQGSVGQPLSHVSVTIEDDEVVVSGNAFLGYINEPETWYQQKILTGDIGYLSSEGYLHILGRKKNLLISSFGRNINPEWVESELLSNLILQQCVVVGDAQPFCSALIQPRNPDLPDAFIDNWVHSVNQQLPDYAQIVHWRRFSPPLSPDEGTLTANGRPVRQLIYQRYQHQIDDFYKEHG